MDDISTPGESADKQGPSCSRAKSGREFKGKESTTELVQGISNQPTTAPVHGTWRITESVLEKESMTSLITLGETAHDGAHPAKTVENQVISEGKADDGASAGGIVDDRAGVGDLVDDRAGAADLADDRASTGDIVDDRAGAAHLVYDRAGAADLVDDRSHAGHIVDDRAGAGHVVDDRAGGGDLVNDRADTGHMVVD